MGDTPPPKPPSTLWLQRDRRKFEKREILLKTGLINWTVIHSGSSWPEILDDTGNTTLITTLRTYCHYMGQWQSKKKNRIEISRNKNKSVGLISVKLQHFFSHWLLKQNFTIIHICTLVQMFFILYLLKKSKIKKSSKMPNNCPYGRVVTRDSSPNALTIWFGIVTFNFDH